jgi:CRP-like cAMP-binding protein
MNLSRLNNEGAAVMSIQDDVELLRRIPMFAKVEPAKLKLLAFTSERIVYDAGQDLFRQGEMADAAYIVIDGVVDVIIDTPAGPFTVAQLRKDALVGDIGVICDMPRNATVKAATRVMTLKVGKDLFLRMLADFPVMALEVMRDLGRKLEHANELVREMRTRASA